jgi:hypothetical protein
MGPWRRLAGLVVALLTVGACTEHDTNNEREWSTPGGSVPPSATTRPAVLDVDGVDPCGLLTADQRSSLKLTGEQTSKSSTTWITKSCSTWDAEHVRSASVTAVANDGIEVLYQGRFANMQYQQNDVRGFPALTYRFNGVQNACYVSVDVADDQLVDVAFGGGDKAGSGLSLDELCTTAHRVAEAAMDTLLAKR